MLTDNMIDPKRFEKIGDESIQLADGQYRNWPADWPEVHHANRLAEFLSKIWTHYGPPNQVQYEGFIYCFLDKEIGTIFTAYSAGSGPAFGGHFRKYDNVNGFIILEEELSNLKHSIEAFEELLEDTIPANCEIQYDTDFGVHRAGAMDGIPFEEPGEKS
jgi:hypothetical protein